jgi:hypothetical protein
MTKQRKTIGTGTGTTVVMTKGRQTIGTGITAREVDVYPEAQSDPDAIQALQKSLSQWEADCKEGGGTFGAACLYIIKQCHLILANSEGRPDPDSDADFAQRIMGSFNMAKAAIERGNADHAAKFAYDVGVLAAQWKIKSEWERHALRGRKNFSALREGTRIANKNRKAASKERQSEWQEMANEYWAGNKHLSKTDVAKRISLNHPDGGNHRTIRRKISKP